MSTKSSKNSKVTPNVKASTTNPNNEKEKKKKKKLLFIIFGSILGAGAIVGAGVGIYFATRPKLKAVKVEVPEINGLIFKNKKAYLGKEYTTEISVNKMLTDLVLPDELKLVKSGDYTITDSQYTYDVAENKETAQFKIPGEYVKGDIKIDLELVPPEPVLDPLLTIEYEYHDGTVVGEDTVGFLIANQDGSEVTFDWGDGSEIETIVPPTTHSEMLEKPVVHQYKEEPKTGNTYKITVTGDLAVFLASTKELEGTQRAVVINKGNFYFKSATLYKNFGTIDSPSNETVSYCALGGSYDDGEDEEYASSNLSQITFSDEVTIIPSRLTSFSKIKTFTIPNQITYIRSYAFSENFVLQNVNLKEFDINDTIPELENSDVFLDSGVKAFVAKSEEVVSKFQAASSWQSFKGMIFYGASVLTVDPNIHGFSYPEHGGSGADYVLSPNKDARFEAHDDSGDLITASDLRARTNTGDELVIEDVSEDDYTKISSSQYSDDFIWIEITYVG